MPTPKGRPRKHAEFEAFLASLPKVMAKRPAYLKGIGIFRGERGDTAWVKIRLRHPASFRGKAYAAGKPLEIKVGSLASFNWDQLIALQADYQGKADRQELLEAREVPTFDECANAWLRRAQNRLKGYETTEVHVRCHLVPAFGRKRLNHITTANVNEWLASSVAARAPATVKRQLNTLKAILNDAIRNGHLESNPCANAERVRGIVTRQRFLDAGEVVRLLECARETAEWLPDFILWALHSGMRKGEIRALRWSDIRTMPDGRRLAMVRTSKADEPRMVACNATMNEVLSRQSKRGGTRANDPVFAIAPMTLRRKWEKAAEKAELEDVHLHDLRRTHATIAAAEGVDLRTLADRIGHTDLTMLQKHYAAVMATKGFEAANTFQAAFDRIGVR